MKNVQIFALAAALITSTSNTFAQGNDDSVLPSGFPQRLARGFTWGASEGGVESTGWDWARADSMAPAGVRLARPVFEGQWRLGYSFELQELDGLRDGRDDRGSAGLFAAGFTTLPSEATFQTHQLELQRGLGAGWSLYGSLPFISREMVNWANGGASSFKTNADGIGDLALGGALDTNVGEGNLLRVNLGVSIPTGSTNERDADENGASFLLPYSMQLGTGTHDLLPGFTLIFQEETWSWGINGQGRWPVGTNTDGWSVGPHLQTSVWASKGWTRSLSTSLRLAGDFWSDVHGDAVGAVPSRNPLEEPETQGGDRIDIAGGVQWRPGDREGTNNLFSLEVGVPVDEWLKGPQLSTDWLLTLGWQLSF